MKGYDRWQDIPPEAPSRRAEVEIVIDYLDAYTTDELREFFPGLKDVLEGVTDWREALRQDPNLVSQYIRHVPHLGRWIVDQIN